jgi:voltage-gated potassium channel
MAGSIFSRFLFSDFPLAKLLLDRLIVPALMLLCTFLLGTAGFMIIGSGRWSLLDCAYMTSITLTTVGYGEVLEGMGSGCRVFAMALMWSGMGVTLYAVSTITAFLVEENLMQILKERRMERLIATLKGHVIVCGAGKTGFNIVKELHATKRPCVVIDGNLENIRWIQQHFEGIFYIQGDATEEETLKRAGIENAAGIMAGLKEDSYNLLITVQARFVNPSIKIVVRCNENSLTDKFYRAGANYVVNPAFIGGMRMASEMIRPHVVTFLDRMLRGQDKSIRLEEVTVCANSPYVGSSLREVDIHRKTGLWIIAMKQPDQDDFCYNPPPDERLQADTIVIVIGSADQISNLRAFFAGEDTAGEESSMDHEIHENHEMIRKN